MSYSQVTVSAFSNGPNSLRRFSNFAGKCVSIGLFITYFGSVSVYTVVAANSFKEVIEYYFTSIDFNIRIYIVSQLPVLILLSYIPNLKVLAPFSMLANLLFVIGLGITVYSMIFDVGLKNPLGVRHIPISSFEFPQAFTITVFAMEAIGVLMPLENNMENPTHLIGIFGALNKGMSGVTVMYIIFGGLGFLAYGDDIEGPKSITSNLDVKELASRIAKLAIAAGVLISYVLQYFVCLNIVWDSVKDKIERNHTLYNYIIRTVIVACSVMLATAVPTIGPFVGLIGAFCFSFLGIIFPVLIYFVTFSDEPFAVLLIKYSFFIVFGLLILFFGSYSSIIEILSVSSTSTAITILYVNGTSSASVS